MRAHSLHILLAPVDRQYTVLLIRPQIRLASILRICAFMKISNLLVTAR